MKESFCKILNIISYILSAVVGVLGAFCLYDWFSNKNAEEYILWDVMHTNAKSLLTFSAIGFVFPLISYIINYSGKENLKFKSKAEVFMSIFLIGIMVSVMLLLSPINIRIFEGS